MMSPLPFQPAYSQPIVRSASTEYSLITEYFFTSESTRDLFYHSRKQLPALEHPNILRVLAVETANEGKLFKVSVHSEDVEWTLERVCLEKWRLGEEWSSTDVEMLMGNVLSALLFARERGFVAADLQLSNIAVTNVAYKLMALSLKSSEAVSESTELETKRQDHIQLQSTEAKDTEKEAIYALGLLSLFLLSPENQGLFATATDLRPHVEALTISEDLKQLLVAMLHPDPTQRPTTEQLLTSGMHATQPSPAQQLATLCEAVDSEKWEEVKTGLSKLFAHGEVSATFTFPCSVCQSPISLQPLAAGVIVACPQHLICKMACLLSAHKKCPDSKDCPCCVQSAALVQSAAPARHIRIQRKPASEAPPQRQCATCKRPFHPDATEKWRLDYVGSAEYAQCENVCSLQCMRGPPAPVPTVLPSETVSDEWLNPQREDVENWNKSLVVLEEIIAIRDPRMQERAKGFLSRIHEIILTQTSGFSCHLCLSELTPRLTEGRFLICGDSVVFICSQECFARHLQADIRSRRHADHVCPTCSNAVRSFDLSKTLDTYLKLCCSCDSVTDNQLPCKHYQCRACYQSTRECKECLNSSAAILGSLYMMGAMGFEGQ